MIYDMQCTNPDCKHDYEIICSVDDRTKQLCKICNDKLEIIVRPVRAIWKCRVGTVSEGRMTN